MRVSGDLNVQGAELLIALMDQLVRDGYRSARLDLADVTTASHESVLTVKRLQTSLAQRGVTLLISNKSVAVRNAVR
jgi:hypothetical protein